MQVTLHARLPVEDAAQRALFGASDAGSGVYPGGHFRSEADVARRLGHLDARGPRQGLRDFLIQENAFAPLEPEQKANLDAAASPRAVYLLTGQQPGLLGGPVLWYYKALTCAALARQWSVRLQRPVIPVFWVAGDDSDLDECNHVELLDARAAEIPGPLRLPFTDASLPLAMGERRVDAEGLEDLLRRLGAIWSPEAVEPIRRAYRPPGSLSAGFLRLAQSQLGREGILFVDGYSRNLRALERPVLAAAVDRWQAFHAALSAGTASALAKGIPAQVEVRPGVVHAFALRDGQRHRLFAEKSASGAEIVYAPDRPGYDLRARLAGMELTHDVFTRPLAADSLFPVLGHVLGPAELRYFAQMAPLFLETTGDMPLVHPRMTAAVASETAFETFRAEGLDLAEFIRLGPQALRARLSERIWRAHPAAAALSPAPAESWMEGLRKAHGRHFRDAGPMDRFERELGASWKRYQLSLQRLAYGNEADGKRILFDHLRWLGNGTGQDRHMSLGSLINELGREGLAALRGALDPTATDLQVFRYGRD